MSQSWDSRDPFSCAHCGIDRRPHTQRWRGGVGWHQWQRPTQATILARMLMRRVDPSRWVNRDGRTGYRKWRK